MSREELEELAWRWRELARSLANSAGEDSSTSSRPPSSDDPYRRGERGKPAAADRDGGAAPSAAPPENAGERCEKKTAKPAGKKPGAKGFHGDQARLLRRALPLRPPEHRPPRRRIALGYRGAPAEPANERVLSGRPDAGDLHRRTVAPLPPLAPQDPGILGRLAEPGARRGDHRTLHPRIRPGERARRRATHSGGARGRYRPSRRDPLVSARRPALDVGGDDGDDDHLPHRQPPQGGTDRADRRRLPGLAGHRRLRRLPRSSATPA